MADLVVTSKLKEAVKGHDLRMDGNLPDAVDQKLKELLSEAAKRCQENGRSTLRPYDL
ncbi:MAG: hypothetical protein R3320_00995 [Nitriliruptorales bacterium]|nr:hypothetical protein [Nitriliruptorales bacterium]